MDVYWRYALVLWKKKPFKPGGIYVKIKIIESRQIWKQSDWKQTCKGISENRTEDRENRFKSKISFLSFKDKRKLLIANGTKWIEKQRVLNMAW